MDPEKKSILWKLKFALFPKTRELIEVPPVEGFSKYLVVSPHPDDGDLFAGGLVAKLRDSGKEVVYLIVTDGSRGTLDEGMNGESLASLRRREEENAARILKVERIIFWDLPDGDLPIRRELRDRFIEIYRKEKPECVLLPDPFLPYEFHPDHVLVGLAGGEAVIFSPMPLFLPEVKPPHEVKLVAFYASHRPNQFLDISPYYERKMRAVREHKSQFSDSVLPLLEAYSYWKSREWARGKGMKLAEGFKVLTPTHLHTGIDSWEV
ncbi:MAG: PIG-L family deacetylase [Caldiserica bacterium]|jgi:LmbE family N-acetylglucosaminyl deacetylase|nr:PIG-L family deacetylase [Caldisericota bacterium]MDH7562186.1 PIG-L family deacetylase [Caldisericota bacterium]